MANHIWDSLVHNESENVLVEAGIEQEPLPHIHRDWLTSEEQATRQDQSINNEVMRRIQCGNNAATTDQSTGTVRWEDATRPNTVNDELHEPDVVDASDSESEEEEDNRDAPTLRRNNRRSRRIAGNAPHYAGLYCSVDGEDTVLDSIAVSNVVQRDERFLSTVDFENTPGVGSPATRYLDQYSYLTVDDTIEITHPYAFSAKVQTYDSDNPTYTDILRAPEERRKLWEASMVKEMKILRDLDHSRWWRDPVAPTFSLLPGHSGKRDTQMVH